MDIRITIIQAVMTALQGRVTNETANIVQDVLTLQLNSYEVQERCTEVAVVDTGPEKILKKYIATKRIEGIADSTLKRYGDENLKLIQFLGIPGPDDYYI